VIEMSGFQEPITESFKVFKEDTTYYVMSNKTGQTWTFTDPSEAIEFAIRTSNGGRVYLDEGTYLLSREISNRFYDDFPRKFTLEGAGKSTVLKRCDQVEQLLASDLSSGDTQIELQDVTGLQVNQKIYIMDDDIGTYFGDLRTITNISGNEITVDQGVSHDYSVSKNAKVATAFPLIAIDSQNSPEWRAEGIIIRNLTFDGNKDHNANYSGDYGALALQVSGEMGSPSHKEITIESCIFYNNPKRAVLLGSGYQIFVHNYVLDSGEYGIISFWGARVIIIGNYVRDCTNAGIESFYSEQVIIANNLIEDSSNGILIFRNLYSERPALACCNVIRNVTADGVGVHGGFANVIGNECIGAKHGIRVFDGKHVNVANNWCQENEYGIYLDSGLDETVIIHSNILYNNSLGAIYLGSSLPKIFKNEGFTSESSGEATITAGNTYVEVSHGLDITPDINKIRITPKDNLNGRDYWISDVNSSTFRINISSSDSVDHIFGWSYYN